MRLRDLSREDLEDLIWLLLITMRGSVTEHGDPGCRARFARTAREAAADYAAHFAAPVPSPEPSSDS